MATFLTHCFLIGNQKCKINALVSILLHGNSSFRIRQHSRFSSVFSHTKRFCSIDSSTEEEGVGDSSSHAPPTPPLQICLSVPTRDTMEEVGALLSAVSRPPDVITLDGDLGAGKTCFARGFVHCKLGIDQYEDDEDQNSNSNNDTNNVGNNEPKTTTTIQVTSPTYLLSNAYPYHDEEVGELREIHHMDLYRLPGVSPKEFEPLALPHVFSNCISLIEWPGRLTTAFPSLSPPMGDLLEIDITISPSSEERVMRVIANEQSSWRDRLQYIIDEGMVDDLCIDEEEPGNNV